MPYRWNDAPNDPIKLTLTAHNSLSPKGFVLMIGSTAALIALPLVSVLGTGVLWALLPFLCLTVAALWFALRRNQADRNIKEVLLRNEDDVTLIHSPPRGPDLSWTCNIYWVRVHMAQTGGPVDHYITLSGTGRDVEIGRFLSEDERKALFKELATYFAQQRAGD